ncbi:MAG: SCP2 sterol-binding domain-containing protein [Thermoplasmataceae archaeon]|jgi:putative sterol carrier protein|nr:SCP2 sterol-binding domain-containing protein [Candidatus Thermoplasmatota archaeon]
MPAKELLEQIVSKANGNEAVKKEISGFNKVFQFKVTDSSPFYVSIENGSVTMKDGEAQTPSATIVGTDAVLSDMFSGKLDPIKAFMAGQIKVSGDVFSTQKLTGVISKLRA